MKSIRKFNSKSFVYSLGEDAILFVCFEDDGPVMKLSGPAADYFKKVFINHTPSKGAIEELLSEYDVEESKLRQDMEDLEQNLLRLKLVL